MGQGFVKQHPFVLPLVYASVICYLLSPFLYIFVSRWSNPILRDFSQCKFQCYSRMAWCAATSTNSSPFKSDIMPQHVCVCSVICVGHLLLSNFIVTKGHLYQFPCMVEYQIPQKTSRNQDILNPIPFMVVRMCSQIISEKILLSLSTDIISLSFCLLAIIIHLDMGHTV